MRSHVPPERYPPSSRDRAPEAPAASNGVAPLQRQAGFFSDSPRQAGQRATREAMSDGFRQTAQRQQVGTLQRAQSHSGGSKSGGLPDGLRTNLEAMSGVALGDVRVHRNSDKPAQLNALAYAQGRDIHLAAGQERHLPHEAWHVVQQAQGKVRPTAQMKSGTPLNTDPQLEREADRMGAAAANKRPAAGAAPLDRTTTDGEQHAIQRVIKVDNESAQDPVPDKFRAAIEKFENVIRDDEELSFLATAYEQHAVMTFVLVDEFTSRAEAKTMIKIKGSGKKKTNLKKTGEDLGALKELLARGTPKMVLVDIGMSYAALGDKSEAYIASVLAHEVGTHVAPYARALNKTSSQKRLSQGEIGLLETAHGTNHDQIDHKALHDGYLKVNWNPFRQRPRYRELIEALAKTQYTSEGEIAELWKSYTEDVSRYELSTGRPNAKNKSSQLTFYQEYEAYRRGERRRYPVLGKVAANKGLAIPTLLGLLLIAYLILLFGVRVFGGTSGGELGEPKDL
jgi:hypothetical protein